VKNLKAFEHLVEDGVQDDAVDGRDDGEDAKQ